MIKGKLISAIIPVYNVEKYLIQCLDSVVRQTYKDLEIILVDDGSADNSGYICDEYASKDNRIKVIHKENGGLSSARNVALDNANGDYIAFVDSDDYLSLDAFEKAISKLEETKADACIFSHYTTNGIEKIAHKLPLDKEIYDKESLLSEVLPLFIGQKNSNEKPLLGFVWRQIFRRDAIGNLRFRSEREYFAEDVVFDLEFYVNAKNLCVINEPLYYYRYVDSSLSNKYRENLFDKLIKLTLFKFEVVDQYGLKDCQERLNNCVFRAVIGGVLNIGKAVNISKKEKREEINKIINNELVKKSIKKAKPKGLKEKVFAFLIKHKLSNIVLFFI